MHPGMRVWEWTLIGDRLSCMHAGEGLPTGVVATGNKHGV